MFKGNPLGKGFRDKTDFTFPGQPLYKLTGNGDACRTLQCRTNYVTVDDRIIVSKVFDERLVLLMDETRRFTAP